MAIKCKISTLLEEREETLKHMSIALNISYPHALDFYHSRFKTISSTLLNDMCNYFNVGPEKLFVWVPDKQKEKGESNPAAASYSSKMGEAS